MTRTMSGQAPCVGTLSYLYDQRVAALMLRLRQLKHEHHDLTIATTHSHLEQGHCLETVMLRGPAEALETFAEQLMAIPGVRHASLNLVPVTWDSQAERAAAQPQRLLM